MIVHLSCFKILRYSFSFGCFSAAFGMTTFWCYRFWKDEDLCLVDYLPYEEAVDIPPLTISLCLDNPFVDSRLREYNTTMDEYIWFLRGKAYYDGLENIDFEDVTLTPNLFYLGDYLVWKNGTNKEGYYPNHVNKLPYVTFAGYHYYGLMKCYGFTLLDKSVKYGYFALNATVLRNTFTLPDDPDYCLKKVIVLFHLADQVLLSSQTADEVCIQNMINNMRYVNFIITNMEILRRRDKRKDPCIIDHNGYDRAMLNGVINKIGCRAPYIQSNQNWTICKTKEKLKESRIFEIESISDNLKQPCMTVGDIHHQTVAHNTNDTWGGPNWIWFSLTPPKKIKLINQVKDVDIQTVIGNAGGYVGLFLGRW